MINDIRQLLATHCKMTEDMTILPETADLYDAGLTCFASVELILALEDHFHVTFPERLLRRATFSSIRSIASALQEITPGRLAA